MDKKKKKIETYHVINYLLPGVVFGIFLCYLLEINIYDSNAAVAVIEYYFTGLVLNRIGSVIIKPILKKFNIIYETDYKKFVNMEKEDEKISLLVREGNQFRTFIATFLILILVEIYNIIIGNDEKAVIIVLFLFLSILFTCSYRKHTKFILKRVENK